MKKEILRICFMPLTLINKLIRKNENTVFFYSNLGFRDNVKAVYDYMMENGYNKKYHIVCAIDEWQEYNEKKQEKPEKYRNVEFVGLKKGIFRFLKAKYAFYSFGKYPIKPAKKQIVVNVWHGMPLKRIGNMEHGKEHVKYNYFTYVIATSDFFADIMSKSFNCKDGQVLINGQPRNDILFKDDSNTDNEIRKGASKVILWLPTYRDKETETGDKYDNPICLLETEKGQELDCLLKKSNARLIVKYHPLQNQETEKYDFENISIYSHKEFQMAGFDLYSYLRNADALITDYSSVYFDYMMLDRPIGFVLGDISQYGADRGFIFDEPSDIMPGMHINTDKELIEFVQSVIDGRDDYADKRHEVNQLVNKYNNGNSTKMLLDRIMK
ncbi:MAG: CDP-glycerol glycerophosphotransferase family protein [Coprococcus sp.]